VVTGEFFAFVEQSIGIVRLRPYRVASSKNGIASRRPQPIVTPRSGADRPR